MKKGSFVIVSIICIILMLVWFNCNPFQKQNDKSSNLNVLDETDFVKATGVGAVGWGEATTGGTGGTAISVTTLAELKTAASSSGAAIITIMNDISAGSQQIGVAGNKTIIGAGSGVKLDFGFTLNGDNVIIKNLDMKNGGFNPGDTEGQDCITMNGRQYIWIDHCTMHEAMDGLIDPCKGTRFVTISYCYFHTQRTAILIGANDSDSGAESAQANADKSQWWYTVTYHHNWSSGVYERSPRVRFGPVHMFNNYIENCSSYAVGRGVGANIYSENNYFNNTTQVWYPWDSSSKPGYVEDVGSLFEGTNGDTTDKPPTGNFVWTPSTYYAYTADSAAWVKANLKNLAGCGK